MEWERADGAFHSPLIFESLRIRRGTDYYSPMIPRHSLENLPLDGLCWSDLSSDIGIFSFLIFSKYDTGGIMRGNTRINVLIIV